MNAGYSNPGVTASMGGSPDRDADGRTDYYVVDEEEQQQAAEAMLASLPDIYTVNSLLGEGRDSVQFIASDIYGQPVDTRKFSNWARIANVPAPQAVLPQTPFAQGSGGWSPFPQMDAVLWV